MSDLPLKAVKCTLQRWGFHWKNSLHHQNHCFSKARVDVGRHSRKDVFRSNMILLFQAGCKSGGITPKTPLDMPLVAMPWPISTVHHEEAFKASIQSRKPSRKSIERCLLSVKLSLLIYTAIYQWNVILVTKILMLS